MITLKTPLNELPHVSVKQDKALEKLGLHTVEDFLLYLPFRYEDYSEIVPISPDFINQTVTVEGEITKTKLNRIFPRRMTIVEIFIQDEFDNLLRAIWFNQPYLMDNFKIGSRIRLSGKITLDRKFLSMTGPAFENSKRETTNTGCLVPVYPETLGLTSKWIRWQMKMLLKFAIDLDDIIPEETRTELHLFNLATAIKELHFPESKNRLLVAKKTLAFREMLLVQIKALQIKSAWDKNKAEKISFDEKLIKKFVAKLPFKLTDAQRKSAFEILRDLEKPRPMNRLLNGDVGSGKTIVSAIPILETVAGGFQAAVLAPTEVLAKQHFESFCKIFATYNFNIALLTNSYKTISSPNNISNLRSKNKKPTFIENCKLKIENCHLTKENVSRSELIDNIAKGNVQLLVGTHAIIQKDVKFKKLAFVVVDEQHRFGVDQRAQLQKETMQLRDGSKSVIPHLLTMSATPIPRTLAIAYFGSLDISLLDEMPSNRKAIKTKIVPPSGRQLIYNFARSEIKAGRQIFIIFPLVEESKALSEVKAATVEHLRLSRDVFPDFKLGLLHGKMPSKEKERVMLEFKERKTDILVATSVVEVGIDIPNATVIIIENAERFGLSQLHQFRGRVGRGEFQSHCFLFLDSKGDKSTTRLRVLEKTNDGFEISKKDLELRGPGQLFGRIQSGLPDIAMENLTNIKLIKLARTEAKNILEKDSNLKKHPALKRALEKFKEEVHLE